MRKNFVYQTFYQILTVFMPLLTIPYLSRVLGADGVGIYSYAYSIAAYFETFILLGITLYGNRRIAQVRDCEARRRKEFRDIYSIQFIMSVMTIILYMLFAGAVRKFDVIYLLLLPDILSASLDITWYFWGTEQFRRVTVINAGARIASVVLIFLLVRTPEDVWIYALITSMYNLTRQGLLWIFERPRNLLFSLRRGTYRKHIRPVLLLFLPVIAISVYKIVDKIMLGALSDEFEVGYYHMADRIVNMPISILMALNTILMPRISNLAARKEEGAIDRLLGRSVEFMAYFSNATAFGLCAVGPVLIPWFLGDAYSKCVYLLYIMAPVIVILSFEQIMRSLYLTPHLMDREYTVSVFIGAGLNFIFNAVLIPVMGSNGAALGTLAAETGVCVFQIFVIRKKIPVFGYLREYMTYAVFGMLMFFCVRIVIRLTGAGAVAIAAGVMAGGAVYVGITWPVLIRRKSIIWLTVQNVCRQLRNVSCK